MNIYQISKQIPTLIFTHEMIANILTPHVNNINAKISYMVKKGELIRIKKGIYIFGKEYQASSLDIISIANILYSPSYVSFDYALSYHGLIPERVYEVTSATMRMKKSFDTQVGRFTYKPIPLQAYALGVDWFYDDINGGKLLATAEKALCDKMRFDKGLGRLSQKRLSSYLEFDIRVDMDALYELDAELISTVAIAYKSANLHALSKFIDKREQNA